MGERMDGWTDLAYGLLQKHPHLNAEMKKVLSEIPQWSIVIHNVATPETVH